ncbi:MAG: DUF502 domain-containing protein [Chlamydiae bacterium]|nr:DUF502 domain-containing protein [Chlamydiota bacterium]
MKKYFITGLAILLPFALTLMIVVYLVNLFTEPFVGITEKLLFTLESEQRFPIIHSQALTLIVAKMISLVFLSILILVLGFLGQKIVFRSVLHGTHNLFSKIPFIKSIYTTTKDLTKTMLSGDQKIFTGAALLPFPSKSTKALGLITQDIPHILKQVAPELEVGIFVPTAPHPISGFILFTSKKEIQPVPITVEQTFKFIISCGSLDLKSNPEAASHESQL